MYARLFALGLVSLAVSALSLSAGGLAKSDSKVKATAVAGKLDATGKQVITLTLDIEKGWHLYANPVGNEDFAGNKTEVVVKGAVNPDATKVAYPKGDPYKQAGQSFMIYEHQIRIPILVQRTEKGSVDLFIRVNACSEGDNGVCLPGGTVKVQVP